MKNTSDNSIGIIMGIFSLGLVFTSSWFLMETWNNGVVVIFTTLPVISYKVSIALYLLLEMFNLNYRLKAINAIDIMINKNYSMNLTMLTGVFAEVFNYILIWFLVTKIIF